MLTICGDIRSQQYVRKPIGIAIASCTMYVTYVMYVCTYVHNVVTLRMKSGKKQGYKNEWNILKISNEFRRQRVRAQRMSFRIILTQRDVANVSQTFTDGQCFYRARFVDFFALIWRIYCKLFKFSRFLYFTPGKKPKNNAQTRLKSTTTNKQRCPFTYADIV